MDFTLIQHLSQEDQARIQWVVSELSQLPEGFTSQDIRDEIDKLPERLRTVAVSLFAHMLLENKSN